MGNKQGLLQPDRDYIKSLLQAERAEMEAVLCLRIDRAVKIIAKTIEQYAVNMASVSPPAVTAPAVTAPAVTAPKEVLSLPTAHPVVQKIKEPTEEEIWMKDTREYCKKMVKELPEVYADVNSILSQIYTKMRNRYSVVFEQESKEYRRYHPEGRVTTLYLVAQNMHLRSLFTPIMEDMYENGKARMAQTAAEEEARLNIPRAEIIKPLVEARGDTTNCGCVTHTVVLRRMRKNGFDVDKAIDTYANVNGLKRKVKASEVIENDHRAKAAFILAVRELLDEVISK